MVSSDVFKVLSKKYQRIQRDHLNNDDFQFGNASAVTSRHVCFRKNEENLFSIKALITMSSHTNR